MGNKSLAPVTLSNSLKFPSKAGDYHRLLCMTGKNKGVSYYLNGSRIVMGRGDKVDIQIYDPKASREHAELVLYSGSFVLSDLGSQNGVVVNDLKVTQHELKSGDKIIIGQTVYKYSFQKVNDIPIKSDEWDDEEEDENEDDREDNNDETKIEGKKKKKINPIILIALVVGAWFMLDDSPTNTATKNKSKIDLSDNELAKDLRNLAPHNMVEDKELEVKLNSVLHRGLREYRERNYFRAIHEFELALMLSPSNARASFYLNKTKQALDDEIERNFNKGKQEVDSLKYKSAVVSYCAIIKLLEGYPEDKRYKTAQENVKLVYKNMGKDESEANCF